MGYIRRISFLWLWWFSKKCDRLCCTFRSGVYCSWNRVYSLCSGRELGSLSPTVLVISVSAFCPIAHRNISFISVSNCSRYCGNISLEFTIGEMSISFAIFTYWTNFRHHKFALELSYFSRLGMDSFWVQVCSPVFIEVSLSGGRVWRLIQHPVGLFVVRGWRVIGIAHSFNMLFVVVFG